MFAGAEEKRLFSSVVVGESDCTLAHSCAREHLGADPRGQGVPSCQQTSAVQHALKVRCFLQ